jgi:hypothetical protein
MAKHRDD